MKDSVCPKCGSREVIPNVRIIDLGHLNQPMDLCATVYTHPEAWIFKGQVSHRFKARVCGECGYTEFYAADPAGLLAASKKASEGA